MPVTRGETVPRANASYGNDLNDIRDTTIFNTGPVRLMPGILDIVRQRSGAVGIFACAESPTAHLIAVRTEPLEEQTEEGGHRVIVDEPRLTAVHQHLETAVVAVGDPTAMAEFLTNRTVERPESFAQSVATATSLPANYMIQ